MHTAYLLTGTNLGDRRFNLNRASRLIWEHCGIISSASSVYQTAAWGLTDQPDFYNEALELRTNLQPAALMQQLLDIEQMFHRQRNVKMGPRIIDIDILLLDEAVINTGLLTVPHPFLHERRFALLPLAEIAPQAMHPVLHKTVQQLLDECADPLDVHKL